MDSGTQKANQIYEIKATLADSQPPIWRRVQVKSDITLAKLHRVLQMVMGWTDMHLRSPFWRSATGYQTRKMLALPKRKTKASISCTILSVERTPGSHTTTTLATIGSTNYL